MVLNPSMSMVKPTNINKSNMPKITIGRKIPVLTKNSLALMAIIILIIVYLPV